ncbi:MAG: hypothetical protein Kow00124_03850 [Anaerolineae bacterium]
MYEKKAVPKTGTRRFTVVRPTEKRVPGVLINLLKDTSAPVLVALSEQYHLPRVPGLSQQALIDRLIRNLSAAELNELKDSLIAARFGGMPIEMLLRLALERDTIRAARRRIRAARARLDTISPDEAVLLEGGPRRWAFTMHGYDVLVDLTARRLACSCTFFSFAARRRALCKHIATAFELIPETYAREALIDLLVWREYGTTDMPGWQFEARAA